MGIGGCSRSPLGSQEQDCRRGWLPHIIPLAALLAQVGTHLVVMRRRNQWVIQSYRDSLAPLNTGWKYFLPHTFVLIFKEL